MAADVENNNLLEPHVAGARKVCCGNRVVKLKNTLSGTFRGDEGLSTYKP